jgi:hypothetical protein
MINFRLRCRVNNGFKNRFLSSLVLTGQTALAGAGAPKFAHI